MEGIGVVELASTVRFVETAFRPACVRIQWSKEKFDRLVSAESLELQQTGPSQPSRSWVARWCSYTWHDPSGHMIFRYSNVQVMIITPPSCCCCGYGIIFDSSRCAVERRLCKCRVTTLPLIWVWINLYHLLLLLNNETMQIRQWNNANQRENGM